MKLLLKILLVFALYSMANQAQAQFFPPGAVGRYGIIVLPSHTSDTVYVQIDTVTIKLPTTWLRRFIDSLAASNGWGGGGGDSVSVSDATNYGGIITGDTANGHYVLHYPPVELSYIGYKTAFSNNASDSCILPVASGLTRYMGLSEDYPSSFVMITDGGGTLQATFIALNALAGNDSTCFSFHFVNSGGNHYITVWKHKLSDVATLLTMSVTTPGFMILKQQISITMKAAGSSTIINWGAYIARRKR